MLSLRRFDGAGLRAYLDELRPRFVTFRLVTSDVRFTWGVPLWALEETASLLLRLLPLLPRLTPLFPRRAQQVLNAWSGTHSETVGTVLEALLSEPWNGLLRLPPGEPFVSIETGDVFIEIRQL